MDKEPLQQKFDVRELTRKFQKAARGTRAAITRPELKGRFRNVPCHCGSGIKTKKCCGKGD
jgi:uncharacterized protein YchJ